MDNKKDNITENDLPKSASTNTNADFSNIFNVASEEVPQKETATNNKPSEQKQPEQPARPEKKKEAFNGQERVLYEIKPEKEGNPIVPVLFFMILITVIFLLPFISKKYSFDFTNPGTGQTQQIEQESEFYYFNRSTVKAQIGNLEFTNFVKSNLNGEYRVSFTLKNNAERTYQFDKKYYIVLYTEKEEIIFRSLIHSYEAIGAMGAKNLTLNISKIAFEKSDRFKIEEIPVSTYPEVKLIEKEGEYEVLQCNYNNNKIKYYFLDGELAKIYDEYRENKENSYSSYENNKQTYKEISEKYNKVSNFSSVFVETDRYYQMINEFDLKQIPDATLSQLQTYRFFKYKESKDTISFELEAQAYTCG